MADPISESENPAIKPPTPATESRPHTNQDWWPDQPALRVLRQHEGIDSPLGNDFDYHEELQATRRRGAEARPVRADDLLAGVVAGRLRPLRPAVHPHVVARGRHLPDRRRPRRRRAGRPALRPAQQLAGQREPRQGSPAAVADQAEVRPGALLGRPARVRRELRDRVDGPRDVRLRVRPGGHLRARGDLLGTGGHLAGRRALQRRARALRPARRGPDGPDLRQPRGPERQSRSAGLGARHPRDVRSDGDERRGDRGADHRRPHVRQDPRQREARRHRARARGRSDRAAAARLEELRRAAAWAPTR